jgi:hypothetical protein
MKLLKVKAVVFTDGEKYFIHGASDETPQEMFKTALPLWEFDPSKETVHYVEIEVKIPEYEDLNAQPPAWDAYSNRSYEPVEILATEIFNRGNPPVEWIPNGNSFKQDEARDQARRELKERMCLIPQTGDRIENDPFAG